MNAPIQEMVFVTLAAQAGLAGDASAMVRLWPDHPTFQYTQQVNFAEATAEPDRELILAQDPPAWLALLKQNGVTSLALDHALQTDAHMDRMTSGFVGGGRRRAIHTSNGAHHDRWLPRVALDHEARERMIKAQRHDSAIWRSSYLRQDEASHGPFDVDVVGAAEALRKALEEIAAFAEKHEHARGWVDYAFAPALAILQGKADPDANRARFSFAPFARNARSGRLLDACQASWVFGGMGSWNDQGFEDDAAKQEYERVSEALFQAFHRGVTTGVNGNAG